jgi:response regulator RpfG family c-di-GMP phosphodiesterase
VTRADARPRVLLVDDEVNVLHGLRRHLRASVDVVIAGSADEALEVLEAGPAVQVVVSDMRMPGTDGAALLAAVRARWPDTSRVLLTGQADLESAVAAVNQGQVFRFLLKPCPPDQLLLAVEAAVEQHRLVTAERELLEQTLRGSVQALLSVLSLAHPPTFARAHRVSALVARVAEAAGCALTWEVEVGAMLSQLGAVSLPAGVLERLNAGRPEARDGAMLVRLPALSERLLDGIPRLDAVRDVVRCQRLRYDGRGSAPGSPRGADLALGARLLRVALDADVLLSQGMPGGSVVATLRQDPGALDPALLMALGSVLDDGRGAPRPVRVGELVAGDVLAEDVVTRLDVLLVGRGSITTPGMVERLRNHAEHLPEFLFIEPAR